MLSVYIVHILVWHMRYNVQRQEPGFVYTNVFNNPITPVSKLIQEDSYT